MDCKYGIVEVKSQEKVIYPERNINYIIKNMEGTMRKRQLMTGKKLAALALAISLAGVTLLSGCGNSNSTASSNTAAESSQDSVDESSSETTELEPVTLRIYFCGDKPSKADEVWAAISEKYKDQLNCTFEVNWIGLGDYKDKMIAMASSGDNWDLNYDGLWQSYAQMVAKGAYLDVSELLPKYAPDLYEGYQEQGLIDAVQVNGEVYALPWTQASNFRPWVLWRADAAEAAGIDVERNSVKTMEDLNSLLYKFKEAYPDQTILALGTAEINQAMRAMVYHPVHGRETQDTLEEIKRILTEAERVYAWVKEHAPEYEAAFVALIYYPAAGTLNLTRMHLLAGMNQYLAKLGALHANDYGDAVEQCLKRDRELVRAYHQMDHGRWDGMGASEHIGFVHWNEDECLNPVIHRVLPADKPRLVVTVDQTMQHAEGSPWLTESMKLPDFLDPACRSAGITLYGLSECEAAYEVTEKPEWLSVWPMQGVLDGKKHNYEKLELVINRERWAMNRDGNTGTSACGVLEIKTPSGCCRIEIPVCENLPEVPEGTFVDTAGYIVMEAEHYADRKYGYAADGKREGKNEKVRFQCIKDYGKTRSAMKAFPVTAYGTEANKL